MHSVFVAGSRALSKLNAQVKERLDNILRKELTVLVGDANGADEAVQRYLAERGYGQVFVYCMEVCRNNVGNWPIRSHSADPAVKRHRHYYGIKDQAMAKDASCGFMLWDGISKGTLANVINLLDYNKKILLFSTPKKQFFTLRTAGDLDHTLRAIGIRDVAAVLASLESEHVTTDHLRFTGLDPQELILSWRRQRSEFGITSVQLGGEISG